MSLWESRLINSLIVMLTWHSNRCLVISNSSTWATRLARCNQWWCSNHLCQCSSRRWWWLPRHRRWCHQQQVLAPSPWPWPRTQQSSATSKVVCTSATAAATGPTWYVGVKKQVGARSATVTCTSMKNHRPSTASTRRTLRSISVARTVASYSKKISKPTDRLDALSLSFSFAYLWESLSCQWSLSFLAHQIVVALTEVVTIERPSISISTFHKIN